ncbi:MAG: polysaccharide biosynthesis/export family protein [Paracoccaceae bacterium]
MMERNRFGGVLALIATLCLTACGVVYTAPDVRDGDMLGSADTDYDVEIVRLTAGSASEANLRPYVPPRLPLAFQPGAVAEIAARGPALPAAEPLPAPTAPRQDRAAPTPDRFPPLAAPEPYRIGVSDVLTLSIAGAATTGEAAVPALLAAQSRRDQYVVQDDGAIAIPDAGRVQVAGLTLQDAEAQVFNAVVASGIDPAFTLEITEFNSKRVSVGGDVGTPSLVPITLTPLFLHEAIDAAGGIDADDPETARVQLVRRGEVYEISLERFRTDPLSRRVLLRDGDAIFVGSSFRGDAAATRFEQELTLRAERLRNAELALRNEEIRIEREEAASNRLAEERALFQERLELGAVARSYAYSVGEQGQAKRIALPFERSATLAEVLFDGIDLDIQTTDYGEIYVLRAETDPALAGGLTAYRLDAENAVNLTAATVFEMRPNDVIFVPEQPVTSWNRVISQILPNLFFAVADAVSGGI